MHITQCFFFSFEVNAVCLVWRAPICFLLVSCGALILVDLIVGIFAKWIKNDFNFFLEIKFERLIECLRCLFDIPNYSFEIRTDSGARTGIPYQSLGFKIWLEDHNSAGDQNLHSAYRSFTFYVTNFIVSTMPNCQ